MKKNKLTIALFIITIILIIDQGLKIWVKTTMPIGEEIPILEWFKLHFVENEGMAFGMTLGGSYGKLALTLFRLLAIGFIGYLLKKLARDQHSPIGLLISISLIMAGAIGNIIDSVLYGVLFSDSDGKIATFLPADGGYAPLLYGKVVDMLWFPLYEGFLPHWLPMIGGTYFSFFRPVFNIADTAITIGVFMILLFQRSFLADPPQPKSATNNTVEEVNHLTDNDATTTTPNAEDKPEISESDGRRI